MMLSRRKWAAAVLDQQYPIGYSLSMYQLQSTEVFDQWLLGLQDRKGRARILARLESVQLGNLGDVKAVGDGVRVMRVHIGPGYRVLLRAAGPRAVALTVRGHQVDPVA